MPQVTSVRIAGMRLVRTCCLGLLLAGAAVWAQAQPFAQVRPGVAITFPRDHGAHPDFRTEWWYLTGWLKSPEGQDLAFQVTFFRSRTDADSANPSQFAPRQILFAHAAVSDPVLGRLLHGQRVARAGFGLAQASADDTAVVLDDWHLRREASGRFTTHVGTADFALDLALEPTQPVLLQGASGFSQKGPLPAQASHYFSLPQVRVAGTLTRQGKALAVAGQAWLDREWSSTLLDPAAVGWDWLGVNLDDGAALTAFVVRDALGQALWAGGSVRGPDGVLQVLGPQDVRMPHPARDRWWRSPRTGAAYPVQRSVQVRTARGWRSWTLQPLMPDSELDSRPAGPVYWEGAVRVLEHDVPGVAGGSGAPSGKGGRGGKGFLELTGYLAPLKL